MRLRPGSAIAGKALRAAPLLALLGLSGCEGILNPMGAVGVEERTLIYTAVILMLLIVVPVIAMTLWFAYHYRASNTSARYLPDFHHSTKIEIIVWVVPCVIIAILGWITYETTHSLDPYRPLNVAGTSATGETRTLANAPPLKIEVVALDWKWLFIYPEQHIATVNEIAFPVGRPVDFIITSNSVMNSFFIPQLGTQIYAMAGMKTQLHLIANHPGTYDGLSANFSGDGFSDMHFNAIATANEGDFNSWVDKVRQSGRALDSAAVARVNEPSQKVPATYYSSVEGDPFGGYIDHFMGRAAGLHDSNATTGSKQQDGTMPGMSGHSGMED